MSNTLSFACRHLRNADPEAWALFLEAFDEHLADVTATVIASANDNILRVQGQAQEAHKLRRIFQECHIEQPATR